MFRELYWCAYGDVQDMPKPRALERKQGLYFDEFEIIFKLSAANVTLEELKRDYEFDSNLYASDGQVMWTRSGGGGSGGPLHHFLNEVRLDNNYAFGPTKKQRGWPTERLAEVGAIGVYQRKVPQGKQGRKRNAKPAKKK